jgi:hypothetical protein
VEFEAQNNAEDGQLLLYVGNRLKVEVVLCENLLDFRFDF